jgi:hypothetical protein
MQEILNDLSEQEISTTVRLALKYSPATKALLGAMLDSLSQDSLTGPLYKSLNHITKYKLTGAEKVLPTTEKWHYIKSSIMKAEETCLQF